MAGTAFVAPSQKSPATEAEQELFSVLRGLVGSLNGESAFQRLIRITGIDDDDEYAVEIQNQGTGGHLLIPGLFAVDSGGVTIPLLTVTNLTVNGTLGVVGTSTLGVVNAGATAVTTLTASSTVQGTRLISTIADGITPSLTIQAAQANVTVPNLKVALAANAELLDNLDSTAFALLAGATFTGVLTLAPTVATEAPLVIKGSGASGQVSIGASNVAAPDLIVKNNAGTQSARIMNSGLLIVGTAIAAVGAAAAGDVQANDLWLVSGANHRRLMVTSTAFQISANNDGTTAALTLDSAGIVTAHGFTADSAGVDATGASTFHDAVTIEDLLTVTSGGISVAGGIGVSGGITMTTGNLTLGSNPANSGLIRMPNSTAISARNAANTNNFDLIEGDASNDVIVGENANGVLVAGTGVKLAFHGASPVAKGAVTGAKGGNVALASLLTYLAARGLLTDSTTA